MQEAATIAVMRAPSPPLAYNPEVLLMGTEYGAGAFRAGHSTNVVQ
jgi:hypothetical protein